MSSTKLGTQYCKVMFILHVAKLGTKYGTMLHEGNHFVKEMNSMSANNGHRSTKSEPVFRSWFKQQIKTRGWTQKDAAMHIGVPPGTVSKWLRRKTPPEMKGLIAIGRAFELPTEDVIVAAGYAVNASDTDADRENRRLVLLTAMPRFADIIDRVARLSPEKQDAYLSVIETMLPPDDAANQSNPQ